MNLEQIFQDGTGKDGMNEIAEWVGKDSARWQLLWELLLRNQDPISRRAAWALDAHFALYPEVFQGTVPEMLAILEKPSHTAMQRHLLKFMALWPSIPEEYHGDLFDLGIRYTDNASLPVAVRVHAMEIAGRIAGMYPELLDELKTVLEAHYKESQPAFKSRAGRWLKKTK
ncbi:MAG: hypothetical protein R3B47_18830 [Bacteroidia bacterium]